MNTLILICLILAVYFLLANIVTEAVNCPTMNPLTSVMSDYLAGRKFSWLQDSGFIALSGCLFLLGVAIGASTLISVDFTVAGVAMIGVVLTKFYVYRNLQSPSRNFWERVHIDCAGLAFLALFTGLLSYTMPLASATHYDLPVVLALNGPLVTFVCYRFSDADELDALEEKTNTVLDLLCIIAILLPRLS